MLKGGAMLSDERMVALMVKGACQILSGEPLVDPVLAGLLKWWKVSMKGVFFEKPGVADRLILRQLAIQYLEETESLWDWRDRFRTYADAIDLGRKMIFDGFYRTYS